MMNSRRSFIRNTATLASLCALPATWATVALATGAVLLGLVIAYTHQHFDFLEKDLRLGDGPKEGRLSLTLKTYALIAQTFHDRAEPPPACPTPPLHHAENAGNRWPLRARDRGCGRS